jgi:hypothetical protein
MEQEARAGEWLEPAAEPAGRLPDAFGHGRALSVFPGHDAKNLVGLAQLVGPQDNAEVADLL